MVAEVAEDPRLVMYWRGEKSWTCPGLLDTNGIPQKSNVVVDGVEETSPFNSTPEEVEGKKDIKEAWLANLDRLNVCSEEAWANGSTAPSAGAVY